MAKEGESGQLVVYSTKRRHAPQALSKYARRYLSLSKKAFSHTQQVYFHKTAGCKTKYEHTHKEYGESTLQDGREQGIRIAGDQALEN